MGNIKSKTLALVLRDHPGISAGNMEAFHFDQFCNHEFLYKRNYENIRERREVLHEIIEESQAAGIPNLILDLVDSLYLDSTRLGLYVELIQKVEKGGGLAIFANPSSRVIQIIEAVDLGHFFNFTHSVGEAIRMLSPMGGSDST